MGVFVASSPLQEIQIGELFALSGPQRLFFWGGIAIGVGVFFSRPVMTTIGKGIVPMGLSAAGLSLFLRRLFCSFFHHPHYSNL